MADRAETIASPASPADPLAGLIDIRGPAPTASGIAADAALSGAIGLALALIVGAALRPFLKRRSTPAARAIAGMAAARRLDPPERIAALARTLTAYARDHGEALASVSDAGGRTALDRLFGTDWFDGPPGRRFAAALYRSDPGVDLDAVERTLADLLRRRGR